MCLHEVTKLNDKGYGQCVPFEMPPDIFGDDCLGVRTCLMCGAKPNWLLETTDGLVIGKPEFSISCHSCIGGHEMRFVGDKEIESKEQLRAFMESCVDKWNSCTSRSVSEFEKIMSFVEGLRK